MTASGKLELKRRSANRHLSDSWGSRRRSAGETSSSQYPLALMILISLSSAASPTDVIRPSPVVTLHAALISEIVARHPLFVVLFFGHNCVNSTLRTHFVATAEVLAEQQLPATLGWLKVTV